MGSITIEGYGEVPIAGNAPTQQELDAIAAAIKAQQAQQPQQQEKPRGPLSPAIDAANYVAGLGQDMFNGLTLGGGNSIAAAVETGGGLWGDYGKRVEELRAMDQQNNGVAASMAGGAGAALPLFAAPALSAESYFGRIVGPMVGAETATGAGMRAGGGLANRLLQYGSTGGAAAATQGFLSGQGGFNNRVQNAAESIPGGITLGSVLPVTISAIQLGGRAAAAWALNKFGKGTETPLGDAERMILEALDDDKLTPDQAIAKLREIGPNASLADVGPNMRQVARAAALEPGVPQSMAADFLDTRRLDSGPRVQDVMMREMVGGDPRAYDVLDTLNNTRKAEAAPLYQEAYSQPPMLLEQRIKVTGANGETSTITLGELFNRPSMRGALARAVRIAQEEGRDPQTLGFIFNEAGDPVGIQTPSWQTMDYMRRGIDDVLESRRDPTTLKLRLDEEGRAILQTRTDFNNAMRAANPAYAKALDAWAGPTQAMEYINNGRLFMRGDPEALAGRFEQMTPTQQEYFRLGAAQELKMQIERAPDGRDLFNSLQGNAGIRRRLATIFPDTEALGRFVQMIRNEHTMMQTANFVNPNVGSQTNPRQLARGLLSNPRVKAAEDILMNLVTGRWGSAAGNINQIVRPELARRNQTRLANDLAPYLFSSDRTMQGALANQLLSSEAGKALSSVERRRLSALLTAPGVAGVMGQTNGQ